MTGFKDFLRELRRRRVFRMVAFYIIAGWVAVQVATLAFQAWGLPNEALRYVWIGVTLGFPLAVVFSWHYEISPGGVTRTPPPGPGEVVDLSLKRTDHIILMALAAAAAVIAFGLAGQIRDVGPTGGVPGAQRQTIAILPLENLTGDPAQDYFVSGMHEALIGNLSKIGSLRVTSRISAMRFGNVDMLLPEIGRKLGVGKLITGSVARIGDQIRITLQLIDALTDENIWTESYDRDLKDILALQGEVARTVAREIQVELTPQEETRLSDIRPVDPETYELYLRGMFHLGRSLPDNVTSSNRDSFNMVGLEYLHQAVERNPADALAWAGLAFGYTTLGHSYIAPPDTWQKARAAAERALKLDPTLAEAHAAMADVRLYYLWDWEGAEESFLRASELNPSLAMNHYHYAWYLALFGRMEQAIMEHKRARDLDPFFPLHTAWLGGLYWIEGNYEDARDEALKSLEILPGFPHGLYVLGVAYRSMGQFEKAIETHKQLAETAPEWIYALGVTQARAGNRDEALRIAEEIKSGLMTSFIAYGLSILYANLGNPDEAYRWLEYDPPHAWMPWIRVLPNEALMRQDPRYDDILRRLNLPR